MLEEIRIHKTLDHPNIVRFYSTFETDTHRVLLLELCNERTLTDMLNERSDAESAWFDPDH